MQSLNPAIISEEIIAISYDKKRIMSKHSSLISLFFRLSFTNHAISITSFEEKHLPEHMRFGKCARFVRFMFYPICLIGIVMLLNLSPIFNTVHELCQLRRECMYYCETDNFPMLTCQQKEI